MTEPTVFDVADMSCGHCEKAIKSALSEALPGAPVVVDLDTHKVTVSGDADKAEAPSAMRAIRRCARWADGTSGA